MLKKIDYPHNIVLKIEGSSNIDYDYVVNNFDKNFEYMLEQKKSLFNDIEIAVFYAIYRDAKNHIEISQELKIRVEDVHYYDSSFVRKLMTPGCRKFLFAGKEVVEKYENIKKNLENFIAKAEVGLMPIDEDDEIDNLEFSNRTLNALKRNGIFTVRDMSEKITSWPRLIMMDGVGATIADEIIKKMKELGMEALYE